MKQELKSTKGEVLFYTDSENELSKKQLFKMAVDVFYDGFKLDLTGVDLSGCDLSSTHFNESYMPFANLSGCDLSNSTLYNCVLINANMENCNMENCNAFRCNFDGSILRYANLNYCDLQQASISYADIKGIKNFNTANLDGTKWVGTHNAPSSINLNQSGKSGMVIGKKPHYPETKKVISFKKYLEIIFDPEWYRRSKCKITEDVPEPIKINKFKNDYVPSPEHELLLKYFDKGDTPMTTTVIMDYIKSLNPGTPVRIKKMGEALTRMEFEKKTVRINNVPIKCWMVTKLATLLQ